MTNLLQKYEEEQVNRLRKDFPDFRPGDVVAVGIKITDASGKTERVQTFEGLCISRKNRGLGSNFTVRKISHGEGVERVFPLYSPRIDSIKLVRRGIVRRAKLYYMRELTGKAARIKEKRDFTAGKKKKAKKEAESAKAAVKEASKDTKNVADKKVSAEKKPAVQAKTESNKEDSK